MEKKYEEFSSRKSSKGFNLADLDSDICKFYGKKKTNCVYGFFTGIIFVVVGIFGLMYYHLSVFYLVIIGLLVAVISWVCYVVIDYKMDSAIECIYKNQDKELYFVVYEDALPEHILDLICKIGDEKRIAKYNAVDDYYS